MILMMGGKFYPPSCQSPLLRNTPVHRVGLVYQKVAKGKAGDTTADSIGGGEREKKNKRRMEKNRR